MTGRLGEVLVEMGFLDQRSLVGALAEFFGMSEADCDDITPSRQPSPSCRRNLLASSKSSRSVSMTTGYTWQWLICRPTSYAISSTNPAVKRSVSCSLQSPIFAGRSITATGRLAEWTNSSRPSRQWKARGSVRSTPRQPRSCRQCSGSPSRHPYPHAGQA